MNKCKNCGGEPYKLEGVITQETKTPEGFSFLVSEIMPFVQFSCSKCELTPDKFCETEEEAKLAWEELNQKEDS